MYSEPRGYPATSTERVLLAIMGLLVLPLMPLLVIGTILYCTVDDLLGG